MRLVLLGPPGAGKGSLALLYETRLGIPHLSTGQIFRQEIARKSALGRRVQRYVTSGRLVPDSLVVQVMAARLRGRDLRKKGFVLDGFPRTERQAAGLEPVLKQARQPVDAAIYLAAPRSLLISRLSGRRVCGQCGANYHIRTMRPKRPGRCDRCKGPLIIRKDDQPDTIKKRLDVDRKEVAPLLAFYRRRGLLHRINGASSVDVVFERTARLFRREGWLEG